MREREGGRGWGGTDVILMLIHILGVQKHVSTEVKLLWDD